MTEKGHGYPPAEISSDKYHGVAKFDVVTGPAPSRRPTRRPILRFLRRLFDRRGGARRQDRRDYGGDAVRHGHRQVFRGIPKSILRCRDRRAAWRYLCRRDGGGGLQALLRDLFDFPSTGLRPSGSRRLHPKPSRSLRNGQGRLCRRGRGDPLRGFRLGLPLLLAEHGCHGARRRGRIDAYDGNAAACDDGPSAIRYPRGRASASNFRRRAAVWKSARAAFFEGSCVAILGLGTRVRAALAAAEELFQRV